MKISTITLKRKTVLTAIVAATGLVGIVSCSDDPTGDLTNQTSATTVANTVSTQSIFTNAGQRDVTATVGSVVRIQGNRAALASYDLENGDPYAAAFNADVVYTENDSTAGYFKMDNGELKPFTANKGTLVVKNMPGATNTFDDMCVLGYQAQTMDSRMSREAYIASKGGLVLVQEGLKCIPYAGTILAAVLPKLFDKAMDATGQTPVSNTDMKFEELSSMLDDINNNLKSIESEITDLHNKREFQAYQDKMLHITTSVKGYFSEIEAKRNDLNAVKEILERFCDDEKYGPTDLKDFIDQLQESTSPGKTHYYDIDVWGYGKSYKASDIVEWRQKVRLQELILVMRCTTLMALAVQNTNYKGYTLDEIYSNYAHYVNYFNKHAGIKSLDNTIVFHAPDAYYALKTNVKTLDVDNYITKLKGVNLVGNRDRIKNYTSTYFKNQTGEKTEMLSLDDFNKIKKYFTGMSNYEVFSKGLGLKFDGIDENNLSSSKIVSSDGDFEWSALEIKTAEYCTLTFPTVIPLAGSNEQERYVILFPQKEKTNSKFYSVEVVKRYKNIEALRADYYSGNEKMEVLMPTHFAGQPEMTEEEAAQSEENANKYIAQEQAEEEAKKKEADEWSQKSQEATDIANDKTSEAIQAAKKLDSLKTQKETDTKALEKERADFNNAIKASKTEKAEDDEEYKYQKGYNDALNQILAKKAAKKAAATKTTATKTTTQKTSVKTAAKTTTAKTTTAAKTTAAKTTTAKKTTAKTTTATKKTTAKKTAA